MTKTEDPRILKLQADLAATPNPEVERIRNSIAKTIVPRGGKITVSIEDWAQTIETEGGLDMTTDYAPDGNERREGNQATNQTLIGVVLETSRLAEEEGCRVGMRVILLKPETSMGYSTRITTPSKDGAEVFTLYIMHYGDVLGIVTEDHTKSK